MKKLYCEYCGELLSDGCNCLRDIEEARLQFIEDYENDPMVQAGWAQQDLIDMRRYER